MVVERQLRRGAYYRRDERPVIMLHESRDRRGRTSGRAQRIVDHDEMVEIPVREAGLLEGSGPAVLKSARGIKRSPSADPRRRFNALAWLCALE